MEWRDYFYKLMNVEHVNNFSADNTVYSSHNFDSLNFDITAEKILKAVKSLKNGKASGTDGISNEMLKVSCSYNIEMYVKLFNLIMKTGLYPEKWRENYIKPIFKGGCFNDPNNYRGIALSSCVAKLFSRVLFNRLDKQLENNKTLAEEQIGFRKECRPIDHVLTLKTLIDKAFKSSNRLYACFVDLKKAYDTKQNCVIS